jgi:hypothetical protein
VTVRDILGATDGPSVFLGIDDLVWEVLSFAGLVLMLGAFALHGVGRLEHGPAYFAMNFVGGALLAAYSAKLGSAALMLLEGAWAVAAVAGWLVWSRRRGRGKRTAPANRRGGKENGKQSDPVPAQPRYRRP